MDAPSPAAASVARSPPLPPPSARPLEPRRPFAPPAGLGSAFPLLGASCEPNIALSSHVDRSGLGGGRTGLRDSGGGDAGTGSPPQERVSAGTAGEARDELPGGLKPVGSTPGTRRWACTERTWVAVPRRAPVRCAVERGGDPPAGDRAEPPFPLKAWDSRWDLGRLGEGHGGLGIANTVTLVGAARSQILRAGSVASTSPPFLPARHGFPLVDGQATARS